MKLDTRVNIYVRYMLENNFMVIDKCFIVSIIVSVKENKEIKVKKNI